tara:strand:- start:2104 stop:5868 length:3765 start_codon:yes stop_codon:yes gene_type:complete
MPLEEGEGVPESQVSFYDIAGHNHDGANSTRIDFSAYNILDVIDIGQLRDIIMGTVNNSTLSPNMLQVGSPGGIILIDGAAPSTVTNLTASSSASTTSDGNIFINVSWVGSTNDSINRYVVELHKSETGINGTYVITRSHETTALSHQFERIDNNAGDGGNIYYKVIVYAISPVGIYSLPATSSGIAPAVNSTPPANATFNDDYTVFDEGVKATFKGIFIYLDDNIEFDVKELRGRYEYQVSINKTSFDTSANLKASGKSKSTYLIVNNLDVRASAGGSKIDYYLRIRAINSSGTPSAWVYYKNTADGGSNGVGTTTATDASAINVLEVDASSDILVNSITANQIAADTITASEILAATITGDELNSITINASRYIQSPDYVTGDTGWRIEGDGNAEFSEATIRGVIYANTGRIGGTNGWTIASGVIQKGTGSGTFILGVDDGSGVPFMRLGLKTSFASANSGVWLDTSLGMAIGSNAWHIDTSGNMWWGAYSSYAAAVTKISSSGDIDFKSGSIDIGGSDSTSWHVDSEGNMWWASATLAAADYKITNWGGIYAPFARLGTVWDVNLSLITNVPAALGNDYNHIQAIVLDSPQGMISAAGGKAVMRGYNSVSSNPNDVRIGIDGSGDQNPSFNASNDIVMFYDASVPKIQFSVEDALLVDDGDVTINDGLTLTGSPTNSVGSYMLSRNAGGSLVWNGTALGGTYTWGASLSETNGTVNHDPFGYTAGDPYVGGYGSYVRTIWYDSEGHLTSIDTETEDTLNVYCDAPSTNPGNVPDRHVNDGISMNFGNSEDFKIQHSGTNTYLSQPGYGNLYVRHINSGDLYLQSGSGGKVFLQTGATNNTSSQTTALHCTGANVHVAGTLSKSSGSFDIVHPVLEGSRLRHSFIEGPQADLIYRGTVVLGADPVSINMDVEFGMSVGTWEALNCSPWSMVTASGKSLEWSFEGSSLTIQGDEGTVCNWMVVGERHDDHMKSASCSIADSDGHLMLEYLDSESDDGDPGVGISMGGNGVPLVEGATPLPGPLGGIPTASSSQSSDGWSKTKNVSKEWGFALSDDGDTAVYMKAGTGNGLPIHVSGDVLTTSSTRTALTDNIVALNPDESLGKIMGLRPVSFTYRPEHIGDGDDSSVTTHKQYGLLAEEAYAVDPWFATFGWVDPDDAGRQASQIGNTLASDDAVPVDISVRAVMAQVVAATQSVNQKSIDSLGLAQNAIDYCNDFDAKYLAKLPASQAETALINDLVTRLEAAEAKIAALEA